MCLSGLEYEHGQRDPQRGLAGLLVLLLYSTSAAVRCSARVMQVISSSRYLLEDSKSSPAPARHRESTMKTYWWIFLVVLIAFMALLFFLIVCFKYDLERRRMRLGKSKDIAAYTKSPWKTGMSRTMRSRLEKLDITDIPSNTREELELECEEFSNIIGSSSDSIIFKGTRDSGAQIAVARVRIPPSQWNGRCELHFLRKVKDLARMKHPNIVNLLAYCAEDEPFERMLVFEYAPNGTVYEHLHNPGSAADLLDWSTRMKIIMGAAYALNFMHTELHPPATHMKFDSSSVFLTESFSAKVAASGMSKLFMGNSSFGKRQSFGNIVRSMGYDDGDRYRHSPKPESNVLSFGLFLLEMISGRRPYDANEGSILGWASEYLSHKEKQWQLVDPSLTSHNGEELAALCEIAKLCTQSKAGIRPTMAQVTEMLATALKMSPQDASLGSSGKIDYKSSPLTWAKLELLTNESECNSTDGEERHEPLSSSTCPLLAGPSSPQLSGIRSPKMTSPRECSSSSCSDLPEPQPQQDDVAVTIPPSHLKQFQQSDSKAFER